ncbi:MAG: hypothetical protein ACLP9L_19120 [Thermoguttaceae bacterium]
MPVYSAPELSVPVCLGPGQQVPQPAQATNPPGLGLGQATKSPTLALPFRRRRRLQRLLSSSSLRDELATAQTNRPGQTATSA